MYCRYCGKEIGTAAWCPYCGAKQNEEQKQNGFYSGNQSSWGEPIDLNTPVKRTNGFAIAGLILAFFSPLLGMIFSVIGLIKSRAMLSGRWIAITGIIISIGSFIFNLITFLRILPELEAALLQAGYTV